ncbi:MAG: DUF5362 family protein [Bacteroidales bacterium]
MQENDSLNKTNTEAGNSMPQSDTAQQNEQTANVPESMNLTRLALENLDETRKWTKFFAILGFVGAGLMVVAAIVMAFSAPGIGMWGSPLISVLYLVLAVLYVYPSLYLFRFSEQTRDALAAADDTLLESALHYLKKSFRFLGIMTIVVIGIYILAIIIGMLAFIAF